MCSPRIVCVCVFVREREREERERESLFVCVSGGECVSE